MKADTVLCPAPSLRVRIDRGVTIVELGRHRIPGGRHALAILDAFSATATFGSVAQRLRSRVEGPADWLDLVSTIMELYRIGALVEPGVSGSEASREDLSYRSIRHHVSMLADRARTASLVESLRQQVQPGDVVVDIGTGSGVLAIAAAAAGARRVYAIEATNMATLAREIVESSGCADRVTVLHGWSSAVTLPERADLLVTELIGDDPLAEGILRVVLDARHRHLKENARLVPNRLCVYVTPVALPDRERHAFLPTDENLRNWRDWYGMQAHAMRTALRGRTCEVRMAHARARDLMPLSEPALVADLAFAEIDDPRVETSVRVQAHRKGSVDAALVHFEADLGAGIKLSNRPDVAGDGHWGNTIFVLTDPFTVTPGSTIEVGYSYTTGEPSAITFTPI